MSDLPDRTNITHDDCSTIIEAWQNGRLIDREALDYEAAWRVLGLAYMKHGTDKVSLLHIADWSNMTVDAALGLDKETTT